MAFKVKGGAIIPATVVTGRQMLQGPAIRVFNAAGSARKVEGGATQPVIEITNLDIVDNGGHYKVMSGPAIPMVNLTNRKIKGGPAIPIYPVDANGNYDATFSFNPLDIAGLELWLAADRGFALVDGDPIATWPDQSGNGRNATQGTAAQRPTFRVNIVNNKPVVRFDGIDDIMQTANFGLVQPEHVFCVFNLKRDNANDTLFDGIPGNAMRFYRGAAGPGLRLFAGAALGTTNINTTDFYVASCLFNGAASELRINRGTVIAGDAGATNGGGVTLGGWGTPTTNFAQVDIAEIIVYDSVLSTANRQSVETYLANKYGITLT